LFSKSDQKEDQVKQAFKARDEAASKSDALELELAKLKEVLEFTIGDLERTSKENRTLSYENEEAKSRMNAMRSEIEALKYCLNANDDTSDKTDVTKELSCSHDEHDTAFLSSEPQSSPTVTIAVSKAESLEAANKQLKQQINELTNQIEAKNDFSSEYDKEKNLLLQRIKLLEGELVEKQNLLAQKSEELEDTVFSFESEKKRLKKENTELAEQIRESSTIASDRNIREVSDEVNRTKNECDTLKAENARLISEQRYLKQLAEKAETGRRDFSMQLEISKQRLIKSEAALAKAENERSESVEQLNAANSKIKENIVLLSETKKELTVLQRANANLEKRDTELRGSVVRIRELVDELTHENADLKTKNEGCQRAIDSLENRTWELESHLNESNELKIRHRQLNEAHDRLMQEFKIASNERENAIYEKEKVKRRLDSIAGAFEADYETVRSKIDLLVSEKRVLERQVALLEASKASVEGNADRILERDNAIVGQNDRLRTECQKQSIKVANLQDEINQLARRLSCLKKENERLSRDNDALRDAVTFTQAKFLEQDQRLKRRKIFEFHSTK
jgi:chromosome segregation ATPase